MAVEINLEDPTHYRRVSKEFETLATIANELLDDGFLNRSDLAFDEGELVRCAEGCTLIREAHRLDKNAVQAKAADTVPLPLTAAFMSISIMQFRPFRLLNPGTATKELSIRANQVLAMEFASSVMDHDFAELSTEMQQRFYNVMEGSYVRCLKPYMRDAEDVSRHRIYKINVTPDLAVLDTLILIYELMAPTGRAPAK